MELRDVVRRLKAAQGIRRIHEETGVHRTIIRALKDTAEAQGWLKPDAALPNEEEIQQARRKEVSPEATAHPLEAFRAQIEQWVQAGHSYVVMHQLIKERCPCSEATLRRFVQKRFPVRPRVSVARPTVAGQDMEVDFGYLGVTYDPIGRRNRKTWLFSGRLRHSRLAWREAIFEQSGGVFFLCHIHALEYFGGVPVNAIPDNLKAAVLRASWEEPLVNRSYRQLAEHYGFLISACPPRRPRAKGGVENDIKYVKHNFWPLFVEQQRERGREVPRYDELVESLAKWTKEVSEQRIVRGVGRSPREIFECDERAALHPLPLERWDPTSWAVAKVAADFRIQFQKGFYTVPYRFIGEQVTVCGESRTVRIFFDLKEIALHQRIERPWQTRSNPLQIPCTLPYTSNATWPRVAQGSWPGRSGWGSRWARLPSTSWNRNLRPTRALLRLASSYSAQRLSRACERALRFATPCYASVKNILVNNLDRLPTEAAMDERGQRVFRFSRRGTDFDPQLFGDSTN